MGGVAPKCAYTATVLSLIAVRFRAGFRGARECLHSLASTLEDSLSDAMESVDKDMLLYLKELYKETRADEPETKRVKFSDIQDGLNLRFPTALLSPHISSMLVQEAFPNSDRKSLGKDRQTYIVGIEPSLSVSAMSRAPVQGATPAEDLQEENNLLSRKVNELEAKIRTLEDQACSSLPLELDSLLQHGKYALRGPDTPAHFTEFSVEAIVSEFQKYAPNIYRLFLDLGDTDRCAHTPAEEKKSLVSMCTIFNARSRKAHGMQLLMSFMLIARATSRQVCTCIYNKHTLNISMCCGWCCFVVIHFMHTFVCRQ